MRPGAAMVLVRVSWGDGRTTVTTSEAVLFPVAVSLGLLTLAVLVTLGAAALLTTMPVRLKVLVLPAVISAAVLALVLIQVTTLLDEEQLQLKASVPLNVTGPFGRLRPVGRVSVMVVLP